MTVTAAMFYLVLGHRPGRVKLLSNLGLFSERVTALPPWCALPLGVLSGALLTSVLLIFIGPHGSMGWGLALLQQRLATRAVRV